jgi:hypothetical protein
MTLQRHVDRPGEYILEVGFQEGSPDPTAPFEAMAQLISTFRQLDRDLAHSLFFKIDPVLTLVAVETGSMRARLATAVQSLDDEALKKGDWKGVVGNYLLRAKRKVLEHLEKAPTARTIEDVQNLQGSLLGLAQETDLLHIPTYQPVPPQRLLMAERGIRASVARLEDPDSARAIIGSEVFSLRGRAGSDDIIDAELVTDREVTSDVEMVLKVKRPDFLGDAMWDFKHGHTPIRAKVEDLDWLEAFRTKTAAVGPGDSLHARVRHTVVYGENGDIASSTHTVIRVLGVLPGAFFRQAHLLPQSDGEPT